MVWSRLLRRERRTPKLPLPGPCWAQRHTLRTQRLLLYTPETELDVVAAMAAGSDPEAQHWLGRPEDTVLDERVREAVLALRPGDPDALRSSRVAQLLLSRPFTPRPDENEVLVAVRLDDGRYAGATTLHLDTGQVGGWLAPHSRGQGLGTELFRAALHLGHAHLGLPTVNAGHEPTNTASARALTAAGFLPTPTPGPPRHTLSDGREIAATWLTHTSPTPPTHCRATTPPTTPPTPKP
ncbi:GNAT family N-acetyltransferase [Streptomyces sp. NPDC048288]|uniref:GNAT family N-acetyltransferase n=1 Tax=Streptomyces sp. NPDC048288 TaxID=3365529 RepID=UPI003710465C